MQWCVQYTNTNGLLLITEFVSTDTLDDSHCTGTTEIVQAIKNVENIADSKEMKIWDQTPTPSLTGKSGTHPCSPV